MTDIIAIVGPESAGKTTLAGALAEHFGAPWVAEHARAWLAGRQGYAEQDVERIGKGQMAAEAAALRRRPARLVLDTDLLVILVWWREKYGPPPAWLTDALARQPRRRYLLTRPDLPWAPDPLRESPRDRERLFMVYEAELVARAERFGIVTGVGDARLASALKALDEIGERRG